MTWVAVAVGGAAVVGAGVSYFSAQDSRHSAENAAIQQQEQAARNAGATGQMSGNMITNARNFAQASPQELNLLGRSYAAADQSLNQQQRLMESIDPSLMEASKQALQILRGGTAAAAQPIMNLRNSQRSELVNSLRAQHGPGAEFTSVGQRALSNFDMQTNVLQQQTLGNLMGIAMNPNPSQNMGRAVSSLNEVGQGYAAIQTRQTNAELGAGSTALGALQGSNRDLLGTAGAGQVGAALQGQAGSALGQNIANTGMTLGMMYARNGSSNPSSGGTNPTSGWSPQGISQPVVGSSYKSDPAWYYGNNPG